jgi:trimethylguanosine synthase
MHSLERVLIFPFDNSVHLGGNTIQFAKRGSVTAIDICPMKNTLSAHNATIYSVPPNTITYISGDVRAVLPALPHHDVVFMSPPWGGPTYTSSEIWNPETDMPDGLTGSELFDLAIRVGAMVCMFWPRNVDVELVVGYAGRGWACEVERVVLDGREKGVCVWYWREGAGLEE